jgi:hypothetical protein
MEIWSLEAILTSCWRIVSCCFSVSQYRLNENQFHKKKRSQQTAQTERASNNRTTATHPHKQKHKAPKYHNKGKQKTFQLANQDHANERHRILLLNDYQP